MADDESTPSIEGDYFAMTREEFAPLMSETDQFWEYAKEAMLLRYTRGQRWKPQCTSNFKEWNRKKAARSHCAARGRA
jgi:hypothetical protein